MIADWEKLGYCTRVGTFETESAVRKRGGSRNLPYLNAKPRQIPLLDTYACSVTKLEMVGQVLRMEGRTNYGREKSYI